LPNGQEMGDPTPRRLSVDKVESPLSGLRVLDLADEKGIFCGSILSQLGAEVIKIEPPRGDPARNIGPFYEDTPTPERSLFWYAYSSGKKSITLDIETLGGQGILRKLVKTADFVVESFTPGYLANLGLDYNTLVTINPGIIMTSITPFGQEGPHKDYNASDIVIMAMSGLMYMCGDPDRPPLRISVDQTHIQGALHGALGSLIALYYRNITGEGQHIDVSLQECLVFHTFVAADYYIESKRITRRSGSKLRLLTVASELCFPCRDGFVAHRVGTGRVLGSQEERLVELMDEEGSAEDLKRLRWTDIGLSEIEQDDLTHRETVVGQYFLRHTKAELQKLAAEHDIMLSPVFTNADILEYEQLRSRDYWAEIEYPELGASVLHPNTLFKSSEMSPGVLRCAPRIGEHNEQVYVKELGLSRDELVALQQAAII